MANKTCNSKPQNQPLKTAIQSQLARVKKEEEEELWISGEELYTEGSSDEEEYKTQSRSRRRVNNNQSFRASSNPANERRGRSPHPTEVKAKSENPVNVPRDKIDEGQFVSKNMPEAQRSPSSAKSTDSNSSRRAQLPAMELTSNSSTREDGKDENSSVNFSSEENETENVEISWKAKRGQSSLIFDDAIVALRELQLKYYQMPKLDVQSLENLSSSRDDQERFENVSQEEVDTSTVCTDEEWAKNEILKIKNLDNAISELNDEVKKAIEETLFCQCENRRRLENILSSGPSESGKLAENTRQFFQLCPRYTMLFADRKIKKFEFSDDKSNISFMESDKVRFISDVESVYISEQERCRITDLMNDLENMNDKMIDSDSNPYIINTETKQMVLELEEKASVYPKDLSNDRDQFVNDSVSSTNSVISVLDTVSTIKSLRDVDIDLVDEVLRETRITVPLSILTVAEDDT